MKPWFTFSAICMVAGTLLTPQRASAQCTLPPMTYHADGQVTITESDALRIHLIIKLFGWPIASANGSATGQSQGDVDYVAAGTLTFLPGGTGNVLDTTYYGGQIARAYSHTFTYQISSDCTTGTLTLISGFIAVTFDFYTKSLVGGVVQEIVLVATSPNNAAIKGAASVINP